MKYPKQRQAEELAAHGRYGDSVLVHMNPIEVAGIASLTPGGLTINPVTGQPEAFAFLIPLLASGIGSAAGMGALGTAALSGAMTAAVTGDLERGFASALMGAGIGSALGAAGEAATSGLADSALTAGTDAALAAGTDAALSAGTDAATQAATDALTNEAAASMAEAAAFQAANPPMTVGWGDMGFGDRLGALYGTETGRNAVMSEIMKPQNMMPIAIGGNSLETLQADADWEKQMKRLDKENNLDAEKYYNDLQGAYRAAQPFAATGRSPSRDMMSVNLPGPWRPGMAGGGVVRMPAGGRVPDIDAFYGYGTQETQPGYGGIDPVTIQANLRGQSVAPPPDFVPGFNPEFSYFQRLAEGEAPRIPQYTSPQMSSNQFYQNSMINRFLTRPPGQSYFQNVIPSQEQMDMQDQQWWSRRPFGDQDRERGPMRMAEGGVADLPVDPSMEQSMQQTREANARFQNILNMQMGEIEASGMSPDVDENGQPVLFWDAGSGFPQYRVEGKPWWSPEEGRAAKEKTTIKKAEGGNVTMNTPVGPFDVAGGGIANLGDPFAQQQAGPPQQPAQPSPEELSMVAAALTGEIQPPDSDQVIEGFIQAYGPEMFAQVREMILQQLQPGAQTQGMIEGQGSGMQDMVPGTIGGQQPVAVSPGEYIVPADVVSGLGDGSSDAGAAALDQMLGNVRQARTGGRVQPPPINPGMVMPK